MARRAPGYDARAALVQLADRARRHAAGGRSGSHPSPCRSSSRGRRPARLVAERAQDVEAGVDDVAVPQHVAAVPERHRAPSCPFLQLFIGELQLGKGAHAIEVVAVLLRARSASAGRGRRAPSCAQGASSCCGSTFSGQAGTQTPLRVQTPIQPSASGVPCSPRSTASTPGTMSLPSAAAPSSTAPSGTPRSTCRTACRHRGCARPPPPRTPSGAGR